MPGNKGYRLYDLETEQLLTSRDVIFYETVFPFHQIPSPEHVVPLLFPPSFDFEFDSATQLPLPSLDNISTNAPSSSQPDFDPPLAPTLRRSTRHTNKPPWLSDFATNTALAEQPTVIPSTQSQDLSGVPTYLPIFPSDSATHFSIEYSAFLANVDSIQEPRTFSQAICKVEWKQAMDQELKALERNNAWNLVPLPHGKKTIGSTCVYKVKRKPDGTVDRYKARLMAKGYHQVHGTDYLESFSLVAKMDTVRLFSALSTLKGWALHQVDINNVFLHGYLDEEVYMLPPDGYTKAAAGEVCHLQRSLYGLK